MTQHHPFLQALASIVPPFERAVADDASRSSSSSSSPSSPLLPEELLSLVRRLIAPALRMIDHLLLPASSSSDVGLLSSSPFMLEDHYYRPRASMMLNAIKLRASDHARDKSRAELLFLTAVLLAIALFVIILPACEALFGQSDDDDDGEEEEGDHPPPPSSYSSSCHSSSSSPPPSCASSCQDDDDDYDEDWPPRRQGGVVELNDLTFLHSRFDSPLLGRGGSVGSGGTCHSHGSCGMETIEESSEEEEEGRGEEEMMEGDNVASSGGTTSDLSSSDSSCPDLDATATEEDDGDDVVGGCEADVADGTVK